MTEELMATTSISIFLIFRTQRNIFC
jgi:hypothetical protein